MQETDVIIVGAGPIGLELAVAMRQAGMRYVHLEAKQLGQTISWFPRQARFFSSPDRIAICGVPLRTVDQSKATREEYMAYLVGVAQQFQLPINSYERVTSVRALPDAGNYRFHVSTSKAHAATDYRARHVVLAIGDMHSPRALGSPTQPQVPGADMQHVHAYFDEPHPYIDQDLLIIGGRNSAAEAAIRCYRAGARVAISYRRDAIDPSIKYWIRPELEWLILTDEIAFYPQTLPVAITADHVTLQRTSDGMEPDPSGHQQDVPADFVLPLIGYRMDTSLFQQAGVDLVGENRRPCFDAETMETNVKGLYVAGTAAAGSQVRYRLFIENGHCHVVRILRAIAGQDPTHINPLAYSRLHEDPLAQEQ